MIGEFIGMEPDFVRGTDHNPEYRISRNCTIKYEINMPAGIKTFSEIFYKNWKVRQKQKLGP